MTIESLPRPSRQTVAVSSSLLTLMLALASIPTTADRAQAGPEKFKLAYKAQAGQSKRVKSDAALNVSAAGQTLKFDVTETDKLTFTEVAPTGEITIEDETEASEMSVNGEKQEASAEDNDKKTTFKIKPNGMLVSYKSEGDDEESDTHLGPRVHLATTPVFSEEPVGVGDKWTQIFKGDSSLGIRDARADYEVLAFEKVGGVDCVKIKFDYTETESAPISSKGTVWVERASGDRVQLDVAVEGIPLADEVTASGTVREERTEGGPLPGTPKPADDPKKPADAKPGDKPGEAKPGDKKPEEKKPEPKKEKTIDEVVKDFEKIPGLLTLYRKKEATKDTIYLELSEGDLGKMMLLQATASTGTAEQIVSGDPIKDIVFRFDKTEDDKVLMVVPNWAFSATNPELIRALKRSFADGYIGSYKVEAKQPDRKSLLIDVTELFRGDTAQLSVVFAGGVSLPGMATGGGFGLDREKTYVQSIRNFPENLVVTTNYHFMRGNPRATSEALADPRSAPVTVVYNLSTLPTDNGYVPRLADPRIGYFTNGVMNLPEIRSFDDDGKVDPYLRFIYRWDLRKKDPNATISEPVKPIVFWMDNAIPKQYRNAVRDGILVWNKAFEKIGFKDAIVVKQMPDTPDPKDTNTPTDTADVRFNYVRWVVSPGSAYAVALFRPNPLTGQILNASITVDAGIVRSFKLERSAIVDPATAFSRGAGTEIDEALFQAKVPLSQASQAALRATAGAHLGHSHIGIDPRYCRLGGPEFQERAWFGFTAISLLNAESAATGAGRRNPLVNEKEYAEQIVRETVAHEMGHILGLRHNFIASTHFSLDDLKDAQKVKNGGIGASVMDYNPFNISALKTPGVDFFSQTIGAYDYWAIEYGYKPFANVKQPIDETYHLKQIARQSNAPGHAYQSDEQALVGFDPMVMQYDLSSDPLAYWEKNIEVSKYLLSTLDKRMPRNGESYYEFTRAFRQLLNVYSGSAGVASRFIGGLNVNRNHKGDPGEKPTLQPIDVARQKRALNLLNTYIFSPTAMNFPTSYYGKLTSDPYGFDLNSDFPVRDQIAGIQRSALNRIFSAPVLSRVANNEFKMGGDAQKALTLAGLFDSVHANVWAELPARQNVTTLRRELQRTYLDRMIDIATKGSGPKDAQMLAWNELKTLKKQLAGALANPKADQYTRVHLSDSLDTVNRTLNAQVTLGSPSSAGTPNVLQMLLGGKDGQK